eukprot:406513-Amphidinium_carterae.1
MAPPKGTNRDPDREQCRGRSQNGGNAQRRNPEDTCQVELFKSIFVSFFGLGPFLFLFDLATSSIAPLRKQKFRAQIEEWCYSILPTLHVPQ